MAGVAVVVFELGREKNPAVQSGGGKQVADEALGAAIGGCRVDQGSATGHQGLQRFGAGLAVRGIVADLEHLRGAQPDPRQHFARMPDRPRDQPRRAGFSCLEP